MAKDIKRFRTYGQQARQEFARRTVDRKVEVRAYRMEAIYTKTAAPVESGARF
jgi:hypothetical protein